MPSDFGRAAGAFADSFGGGLGRGFGRTISDALQARLAKKQEEQEKKQRERVAKIYEASGQLDSEESTAFKAGYLTLQQAKDNTQKKKETEAQTKLQSQQEKERLKEYTMPEGRRQLGMEGKVVSPDVRQEWRKAETQMKQFPKGTPKSEWEAKLLYPEKTKQVSYKPTEGEKLDSYRVLANLGRLTNPQHRSRLERAGFDPDTGEKVEKLNVEALYREFVKWKEKNVERLYRQDPQTGEFVEVPEEELMEMFARERQKSQAIMSRLMQKQSPDSSELDDLIMKIKADNDTLRQQLRIR